MCRNSGARSQCRCIIYLAVSSHFSPFQPFNHSTLQPLPQVMYANYHDPLSEQILLKVIERTLETPDAWPLIVSRIDKDKEFIRSRFGDQVNFLEQAVDGLQLIWNSDVFISGGGTMNREAGLLAGGACKAASGSVEPTARREDGERKSEVSSQRSEDGHRRSAVRDRRAAAHADSNDLNDQSASTTLTSPEGRLNDLNEQSDSTADESNPATCAEGTPRLRGHLYVGFAGRLLHLYRPQTLSG